MNLTGFACFELGAACNLSRVHSRCPNRSPERYAGADTSRPMTDDMIVDTACRLYEEHGFRGLVAFHYYNEPLTQADRMFRLMGRIHERVPQARFVLWTNGTLIPEDCSRFSAFSQIHVTDYTSDGYRPKNLESLRLTNKSVEVHRWQLDDRLTAIGAEKYGPCARQHTEIIFNAYGGVMLCCYGWRHKDAIGNIMDEPLADIVKRWQAIREDIAGKAMSPDAPAVCLRCVKRHAAPTRFVHEIVPDVERYLQGLRSAPELADQDRTIAVVFVHYAMPEERLKLHFEWNDQIYRDSNAEVYVVTDRQYDTPEYAQCLVFPEHKLPLVNGSRKFSLSRTKNHGIDAALHNGCDVLVVTDSDVSFAQSAWGRMCSVASSEVVVPVYRMLTWFDRPDAQDHWDYGCTGTIAMVARLWRRYQFNPDCWGYGAEDGLFLNALRTAGLSLVPGNRKRPTETTSIRHMPHTPGQNPRRVGGHGNATCWNRDTINPDNFEVNRRVGK